MICLLRSRSCFLDSTRSRGRYAVTRKTCCAFRRDTLQPNNPEDKFYLLWNQ